MSGFDEVVAYFCDEKNHWQPTAFGGVLLGFLLPFFIGWATGGVIYLYRFISADPIKGIWFSYHWTYIDAQKPQVVKSKVMIKRAVKNRWKFKLLQTEDSKIIYHGVINPQNDHLICTCSSTAFPETTYIRIYHPIGTKCDTLVGVWMSYDHKKRPAAGAILLSRREVSLETAGNKMSKVFKVGGDKIGCGIPVIHHDSNYN